MQHWFCGVCKTVEECSQYVTMIYHKHDTSLVILSPLSQQTAQELRTKITTVKKARNRDKAQTLRTALAELTNASLEVCNCKVSDTDNAVTTINPYCIVHGYKGTHQ